MQNCNRIVAMQEIEITDDGSATIYIKELDEHYHSVKGALTESEHIYCRSAYLHRSNGTPLRLLEIGYGTGLNAVVTAMAADSTRPLHYISIEKYPVSPTTLSQLNYGDIVDKKLYKAITDAPWNKAVEITPYFTLEKIEGDYLTDNLPQDIDIVYFDAFAPEKQPEMWSKEGFERLFESLSPDAVLTTYCAKGSIRRMLIEIGFSVERLAGPPNGKREILRATKKRAT